MKKNKRIFPDYLIVGHVTHDIHGSSITLGGTAAYAAVCARALGRTPAIVTAGANDHPIQSLDGIDIEWVNSKESTTFENKETDQGRIQFLHSIARQLRPKDIPDKWKMIKIVHLGPVANEVDQKIANLFPNSFIGITPQGWMRMRDNKNMVHFKQWENAENLLQRANAVVISIEDVRGNEEIILTFAEKTEVLVVTEGFNGARIYWNGDVRHFSAPKVNVVDPTGAGDIFAAAFFDRLEKTHNPWESGIRAVQIASQSVTRKGLAGVPTKQEIRSFQIEVIEGK